MSLDLDALSTAIFDEFEGDADALAALVGGFHAEEAPQDPSYPYGVFLYITGVPDPTFTSDGEIATYQFSIYHKYSPRQSRNRTVINDAVKKLTAAFDDATLTITGHTSIGFTRGVSNALPNVDGIQSVVINYEFMVEDD